MEAESKIKHYNFSHFIEQKKKKKEIHVFN